MLSTSCFLYIDHVNLTSTVLKSFFSFNQVGWLRAEDQTVLSLHERVVLGPRYSVSLDSPGTWQLRIRPLRADDRGCYMCQINTQPSMKYQIGCIDVYGKIYINILDNTSSAERDSRVMGSISNS